MRKAETARRARRARTSYPYLIVGAGPAGLQLGYYLEKAGRDYLILEAGGQAGTSFEHYPRHRKLLSINKVYTGRSEAEFNLRHDWNSLLTEPGEEMLFKEYTREYFPGADVLVAYLRDYAARFALKVEYGCKVARIGKDEVTGRFQVETADGAHLTCTRLIMATGLGRPYVPAIPGIELTEGYEDVSVDPEEFADKSVLILGKGNSAFETADNLIATAATIHLISPHPIRLAWETHFVGHLRAVNNNLLDSYQLKSQNACIDGNIESIARGPSGKLVVRFSSIHAPGEVEQLEYDRVIRCTGFAFDDSVFDESCRPAMAHGGRLPGLTPAWESENVAGLYFAGTTTQSLDYKRSQSGFIHGFRYNTRTLFHLLERRYHGRPLPHRAVDAEPYELAREILRRMGVCSSLWQQVGFLCDAIVLPKSGKGTKPAQWYFDLTPDYVLRQGFGTNPHCEYYLVQFRFGSCPGPVFDHPREGNAYSGEVSAQIHPVVRRYKGAELQAEHHVLEDFLNDWEAGEHLIPLAQFFAGEDVKAKGSREGGARVLIRDERMRVVDAPAQ